MLEPHPPREAHSASAIRLSQQADTLSGNAGTESTYSKCEVRRLVELTPLYSCSKRLIKADSGVYLGCYLTLLKTVHTLYGVPSQTPSSLGVSYSNTHACALVNAAPIQKYCHTHVPSTRKR